MSHAGALDSSRLRDRAYLVRMWLPPQAVVEALRHDGS
jgi:hypothetical protein